MKTTRLCHRISRIALSGATASAFAIAYPQTSYADTSITGSGGTIIVNSSGSSASATPGGIEQTTTTKYVYYNGWPYKQSIPIYYVYSPQVVEGNPSLQNQPCLAVSKSQPIQSYWEAYQLQQQALQTWNVLAGSYPLCQYKVGIPTKITHVSPSQIVTAYWKQTIVNQLPSPNYSIPPGFALTGMPAFLVSNCVLNRRFYDQTQIGTADIVAQGQIWVRWDNNLPWSGPYQSCGTPWPNGTISHVYQTSRQATISVKETWTANWTLNTSSGSLSGLNTSAPNSLLTIKSLYSEIFA